MIDNKYPFSLGGNTSEDGKREGILYNKIGKKIALKGKFENGKIILNEYLNGKITGSFEFKFSDKCCDGYSYSGDEPYYVKGFWRNSKSEEYQVQIQFITKTNED